MNSDIQTVVVTGANRGIGLALIREYKKRGARVIGICRKPSAALEDSADSVITNIDVGTDDGVAKLAKALEGIPIDLLINNAGILSNEQLGDINYHSVIEQLNINALGPLRVTEALAAGLKPGAKVAMITSRMGSITDNGSGGYYGYRMSKAALNAAAMSLAKDLKTREIAVAILHPGFVQTEMVGGNGDISPDIAAERLAQRIDDTTLDNSGTFWHSNGEQLPW